MTDRQAQVRAAAYAAASWARARRAAWTDPDVDPAAAFGAAIANVGTGGAFADSTPAADGEPEEKEPAYVVTLAQALAENARSLEFPTARRLAWRGLAALGVVASLIALVLIGREYWQVAMRSQMVAKVRAAAEIAPPRTPAPAISVSTGTLHVTSAPSARVIVDGTSRGVTPLLVENLSAGVHSVLLQSSEGTVEESVTITAGDTQELAESIYAGWLTLYSPFDVVISEHGRAIALDEQHQAMLAPGEHNLQIANRALGYQETRHVAITPGAAATLSIVPPKSTLTVKTNAPSQVWLDGTLVGDAPIDVPAELGTHELVVEYPNGERRQRSVTVTTQPLVIDM